MQELRIYQANPASDAAQIRDIFFEYMDWANGQINKFYGVNFDIRTMLEEDMLKLGIFLPPKGRLLLSSGPGMPSGIACMRANSAEIAEVKRMYVRPDFRRQGVGRALLVQLIQEAAAAGYRSIRLDSAGFMLDAHRLYRSLGFQQIAPYPGSEIPVEFHQHWVFMEKQLVSPQPSHQERVSGTIPSS